MRNAVERKYGKRMCGNCTSFYPLQGWCKKLDSTPDPEETPCNFHLWRGVRR